LIRQITNPLPYVQFYFQQQVVEIRLKTFKKIKNLEKKFLKPILLENSIFVL